MATSSSMLTFKNGPISINGYCALPGGPGPHPAVIVIHEVFGVTDHIKEVCNRIAAEGYLALAVDLYSRQGMPNGLTDTKAILEFMATISDAQAVSDLVAGVEYLRGRQDARRESIGVVGFCMGGTYTHMLACSTKHLVCAASFYGGLRWPHHTQNKPRDAMDMTGDLGCPILSIFGDKDPTIPLTQVRELQDLLTKLGKRHEVIVYPGAGHAFFNDTRPTYHAESAKDAWKRLRAFFAENLSRS
ncbi:MAG: dienelactone hydrolase family protein [Candidatus Tectomicrobia bacterium]|nr:dienelactone hydrolase family protein [Candidatus Tectomicrobia bacterium]